ncbi:HDR183Wp [Eremothecium sinecaudum]|uniref:HDR183Wp n=1 Tax=Eremothecium sinecaudum TaxID=45286 RepID=A0A120K2A2_9SACH|nr:HDR183Wp [Eremothecium sinecaudum]AMD20925.1 HDR183Wp [Eremothecium sinecaudum]
MPSTKQLIHIGFDLVLVSVILAGVRRNTGYVLNYESSDLRNYIQKYLNWGEYFFDHLTELVKRSSYFKKQSRSDGLFGGIGKDLSAGKPAGEALDHQYTPKLAHLD